VLGSNEPYKAAVKGNWSVRLGLDPLNSDMKGPSPNIIEMTEHWSKNVTEGPSELDLSLAGRWFL
jgi:hypothetical protein